VAAAVRARRSAAPHVAIVVERAARVAGARVERAEIVRRARAMMNALQLKNEEISIVLTGDEQIRNLNKIYRMKDRATDVLAFAQREGEHASLAGDLLGDVIVSVPTASRQANANRRDLLEEITMLVAHGILHLLGWDHDTAAKDKRMRAETDRLCEAASATRGERARPVRRARASAQRRERRTR
jgi:probable rRNA maturation factor